MLNLHKLFLNSAHPHSFDEVIEPTEDQRKTLVAAKNLIRERLRQRIGTATTQVLDMDHTVKPRFRTQGSWTYKTCVRGAHVPPQEMDWDFGVYLPVTVWTDQGPPKLMAKLYFDLVEAALHELCDEQGWSLDSTKPTCVRVQVASWAHIDVPLYAAPEEQFLQVMEKAMASVQAPRGLRESVSLEESAAFDEMPEPFWEEMECIHLATRDGQWKPSDPEAVSIWFNDRIAEQGEHGEQLRRVCRYLKAWRDHQWIGGGGPSSVLIMMIVARQFQPAPRREDLALERAAAVLAQGLSGDVFEQGIDGGVEDFNRLDADGRIQAASRADHLARQLHVSRHFGPGLVQTALDNVRALFGSRIADNHEFVQADNGADVVMRTPAVAVAPPVVGATHAG